MSLFDQVTSPRARGQIGADGCLRGNLPVFGLSQALVHGQESLGSHQDCSHLNVSVPLESQAKKRRGPPGIDLDALDSP